jgi:hypothetical protein
VREESASLPISTILTAVGALMGAASTWRTSPAEATDMLWFAAMTCGGVATI